MINDMSSRTDNLKLVLSNKLLITKLENKDLQFHGKDGRKYPTSEEQIRADEAYFRETHRFIVFDAEQGRREIVPGTGPVKICVGYLIESDPITLGRRDVLLYRTQIF